MTQSTLNEIHGYSCINSAIYIKFILRIKIDVVMAISLVAYNYASKIKKYIKK